MAEIWEKYGMILWITFYVIVLIRSQNDRKGITQEEAEELRKYLDQLSSS